jgi:hypothetical protein
MNRQSKPVQWYTLRPRFRHPPVETLRLGHGSCRDFAMLMIEAARALGFAARFASGYLAVPLDNPHEPTSGSARGSTHAWAQIYLLGTGWIDFDPCQLQSCAAKQRVTPKSKELELTFLLDDVLIELHILVLAEPLYVRDNSAHF